MRYGSVGACVLFALGVSGGQAVAAPRADNLQIIHSFGGGMDGSRPNSLITLGATVYGTTYYGGSGTCGSCGGTIFAYDTNTNTESVLYSFSGNDQAGQNPSLGATDGKLLYGHSFVSSQSDELIAFNPDNKTISVIAPYKRNDFAPSAMLVDNGTLYAASAVDGTSTNCNGTPGGCGGIFAVSLPTGTPTSLYQFPNGTSDPLTLTELNGEFYGTTYLGAALFSFTPSTDVEKTIAKVPGKGEVRFSYDLIASGTTLYGLNSEVVGARCAQKCGVIYSYDVVSKKARTIYTFNGGTDGTGPVSIVVMNGLIYGATEFGGAVGSSCKYGCGTLFSIDPATGLKQTLYSFSDGSDGAFPATLQVVGNTLFGIIGLSKAYPNGALFAFTPQ